LNFSLKNHTNDLFSEVRNDAFYNQFISIEPMTTLEILEDKNVLRINYSFHITQFGKVLIASTKKGICYLAFCDNEDEALIDLNLQFSKFIFIQSIELIHLNALLFFNNDIENSAKIVLHIYGTAFQLKVWELLLQISIGRLTSYSAIANNLGRKGSARAIGNAIGCNPVAYLIPCHRVIQLSGKIAGYKWGVQRKINIINWEAQL
jgi:AraC family transcriptional regulator of adaptative response/methylated-DNA-[protein]-cysteine methyltransferase